MNNNNINNNYAIPTAEAVPDYLDATSVIVDVNGNIVEKYPPQASAPAPFNRQYSRNYTVLPNENNTKLYLTKNHWPGGLQNLLLQNIVKVPFRFFICDDSGSMSTNDGNRLVGTESGTKVVKCSRWTEMTETLKFHAGLANALNMPSEFRLLNSAPPIRIGGSEAQADGVGILDTYFNDSPGGGTPLCRHIREVTSLIRSMEPTLRSLGQKVSITIMTDGESSDGDLAQALAPLQQLPVWLVVRLCTDDENVVNYWNSIDEKLELEMDVLDDLLSEGEEVMKANPWLNYTEPIHRLREFGLHMKEFDLIDESCLSPDQIKTVCCHIFNLPKDDLPHPEANKKIFLDKLKVLIGEHPIAYSLGKKRMMPWIDINAVNRAISGNHSSCSLS